MSSITISSKNPTILVEARPLSSGASKQNLTNFMRPRFFRGQFLTDQDLMALLNWTQGRLGLSRLRHGWGIVCGLDLHLDPKNPSHVIISSGYAVSPQGEDVILTQDVSFDLSDACLVESNPCCPDHESDYSEREGRNDNFRQVNLFIRYQEELRQPQTALGSGTCNEAANCEYSRVKEHFSLHWQHDVRGADPMMVAASQWQQGYEKSVALIEAFQTSFHAVDANNITAVRNWLCRWIEQQPLSQLGYIKHALCQMNGDEFSERILFQVLLLMAQDYRNAFLESACAAQESEDILLGQVWVKANENDKSPTLFFIDAKSPYRREIQIDQWPAPLGMVNAAEAIWHREADARAILINLGLQMGTRQTVDSIEDLRQLRRILYHQTFFHPGETVTPVFLEDNGFGRRLIGFQGNNEWFGEEESPRPRAKNLWGTERESPEEGERPPEMESPTEKDDLTAIKGIGMKREEELNNLGIYTFVDLVGADVAILVDNLVKPLSINQVASWQEMASELIAQNKNS